MNKVLLTGADGFIGSHLAEKLVNEGYDVKALVQYNSFGTWGWLDTLDQQTINHIEIISGDIRDPHLCNNLVKGCNRILHLAALIAIPYSYSAPQNYIDTNISGTCNLMQSALLNGVDKFIQTSTSEVYGTAQYVPIDEVHPLSGQSPYAASKIGSDQLALSFYNSFDLPVTVIRPFNTYGPRQSARAVIPSVIIQLAKGNEISMGGLSPTRDFNFVTDIARGFIAGLETSDALGEVINLGSNFEISVKDTALLIAEIMNKKIEIKQSEERIRPKNSEVERLFSSNQKAKDLLKWEPEFFGLEGFKKGLIETINWFSVEDNLRLYKSNIYNK
jgi:NAD dependent epimerase/dehydratase